MQVPVTTTTSNTDTVTPVILKSQVSMLAKKGDTLVDQGGNSYSINALMLSGCTSLDHGISNTAANWETNIHNLL